MSYLSKVRQSRWQLNNAQKGINIVDGKEVMVK
jgi:hypothetical protein